jgi:hypothetical protein
MLSLQQTLVVIMLCLCGKRVGRCLKFLRTPLVQVCLILQIQKNGFQFFEKIKIKELLVLVVSDTLKNLRFYKRRTSGYNSSSYFDASKFSENQGYMQKLRIWFARIMITSCKNRPDNQQGCVVCSGF